MSIQVDQLKMMEKKIPNIFILPFLLVPLLMIDPPEGRAAYFTVDDGDFEEEIGDMWVLGEPEPTTAVLLTSCLMCLAVLRKKFRKF